MTIYKVINNNIVLVKNSEGKEVVVMGKGLGFGRKPGAPVDEKKIEKRFVLDHAEDADRFTELAEKIPKEHLNLTIEIIEYANKIFGRRAKLSSSIYITLADHIDFAVQRMKQGLVFGNPLLNEVKVFYPTEYLIGEYGVALVKSRIGVTFPEDEAASIALHVANAEYDVDINTTMKITGLISECTELVKQELHLNLDIQGLDYSRFVTHLKFMCQRIFTGKMLSEKDDLSDLILGKYEEERQVALMMREIIDKKYDIDLTDAELAFLTIHIRRMSENER